MDEMKMLDRLRQGVPPQTDLNAERDRLLTEIRGEQGAPAAVRHMPTRRAIRLPWRISLAGAVGLAAAVSVVAVTGLDGEAKAPVAKQPPVAAARVSAVSVLEKAALVAEKTRTVEIRPDQWFYTKQTQNLAVNPVFEHWVRMDGSQEAVREWKRELKVGPGEQGPMNPAKTQRTIENLPTDPDAMLKYLHQKPDGLRFGTLCRLPVEVTCSEEIADADEAYEAIQWYMKYGPIIPPEKLAAMYRAMAKIPHITIEENATTMEDRKGIGVVLDAGASGKMYTILDPGDYHYLGEKTVQGDKTFGRSILASGVVDKPGETP
jgi:hypothetical protein